MLDHMKQKSPGAFLALVIMTVLLVSPFLVRVPRVRAMDNVRSEPRGVTLAWGVEIPMRDDVKLIGALFKPGNETGPIPTIITITPYNIDTYMDRAMFFARNGYAFLLVDCRGRGNSGGTFFPNTTMDGRDAYDVIEWIARQPWSDGQVGMWGGSYAGFNQWAALKESPPHLKTIVPAGAAHPGVDFPYVSNIPYTYLMEYIAYVSGVTGNLKLFSDSAFWIEKYTELYRSHRPFKEFDRIVGIPSAVFQTWVSHPTPEPFFTATVPKAEDFRRFDIPILTITGIYDTDQLGALAYYRLHQRYGSTEGFAKHHLIIGPWDHAGTRTPNRDVGGLRFGEACLIDLNQLHLSWYDWIMKKGEKPAFLKSKVAYYVTGTEAEVWKYSENLETIAAEQKTLYLHSTGVTNDVFASGALTSDPPGGEKSDSYVYDPLDTRPAEDEQEPIVLFMPGYRNPLTDQKYSLHLFGNGLIYHTKPFPEAVEVSGVPTFKAWMSMDVPDTDFEVTLYEILPNGSSVLLTQDRMRARYRESLFQEKLVKPGEVNLYEFESFYFVSRRISKGSRLRILLRSPNSIYWQKNYNNGGVVAEESAKDARTAHVTLYHDAYHPSNLEIPVARSSISLKEIDRIRVQHILISFKGTSVRPEISRTRGEAETLANAVYEKALKGEDFDDLVKRYTNDKIPGIYCVANFGITPDTAKAELARAEISKSFGDVAFGLKVSGIGLAEYDPVTCKYGWHIIKRLE
jgi:uncharacterized protein